MSLVDHEGPVREPVGASTDAPDGSDDFPPPRDDGSLRTAIDIAVVAACAGFVFWQLHPDLLLADTTPAGGDMGAHVWALGYLRDVLIPSGRLSGWTPDWYAGFPVFQFYMVVPFVAMVVLNAGVTGVASILPTLGSLGLSAQASGRQRGRPLAVGFGVFALVALAGGLWSGYGTGFRFIVGGLCVAVAIVAGVRGTPRRRWWWATAASVVALVGIGLPYGGAFKLVTISGVVAMPVSAYMFGRLARFPYPTPALLAVATLGFLFDKSFTIYGGNIASTMAGEFAFSISLALAIAFLGVLVHGLRTGTHRVTAGVLLGLVGLCHLIPAFFALGATVVLVLVHVAGESHIHGPRALRGDLVAIGSVVAIGLAALVVDLFGLAGRGPVLVVAVVATVIVAIVWWSRLGPARVAPPETEPTRLSFGVARLYWLVSAGALAALLAAWWVLPFFLRRVYLNDMGWEKIAVHAEGTALWAWFTDSVWPELVTSELRVAAALALVGAVVSVAFRNRIGSALVVLGLGLATAFVFVPQGRLWNARLLPFWYLVVYFLAAVGIGEVVRALAQVFSSRPDRPLRSVRWVAAPIGLFIVAVVLGGQLHNLPTGRQNDDGSYRLLSSIGIPGVASLDLPDAIGIDVRGRNFVTDWSRWNYSGYERKDAYPEYRDIVSTMADVGRERGCGMSLWEYSSDLNDYGTPMALMLLPHWTDGCIGSMEGLYFEASSTTPFHFLMQSELSAAPSRAQRDLPYRELDMDAGVEHLQLMGVRYYTARSPEAVAAADEHPDLVEIAASGPWVVYEVTDAPMVQPLAFEPAVTTAEESQGEWLGCKEGEEPCPGVALEWFQDPSAWHVALAATGPDGWQRVEPGGSPDRRPVPAAVASDVEVGRDGISFTVDRPGTPVLVKQSYFPNWEVEGADGPYRVAPNLMIVVPTDTDVSMTYGRTGVDLVAIALTLGGVALAVVLARAGPVAVPRLRELD